MAAIDFERGFQVILKVEGADTNDPNDPGGLTRFGIAQRYHPDVDVANLDIAGARRIYDEEYWGPSRCNDLLHPLDIIVFAAAVLDGVYEAAVLLQQAIGVKVDGKVGPITLAKANSNPTWSSIVFCRALVLYYISRGKSEYVDGWIDRVFKVCLLLDVHDLNGA